MKDDKKFKELLHDICERFSKNPSETMVKRIWEILLPYTDKEGEKALNHVFENCRYYKDLIPDLVEAITPKKAPDWW